LTHPKIPQNQNKSLQNCKVCARTLTKLTTLL
jgi:hypothetical protein